MSKVWLWHGGSGMGDAVDSGNHTAAERFCTRRPDKCRAMALREQRRIQVMHSSLSWAMNAVR